MFEGVGRRFGEFFGGLLSEGTGLNNLKKALERFFEEAEKQGVNFDFSAEIKDNVLITRSRCPIHKIFSVWCEGGCISFVEGFASKFNVKVKRTSKQPEDEFCTFEFSE